MTSEVSSFLAWQSVIANLGTHTASGAQAPRRFNPKPRGVVQHGSATDAVLRFLTERSGVFFTHAQIVAHTSRTVKAVDWALIFLRDQGLIEAVPDAQRNPRYRRYRAPRKDSP